MQAQRLTRSLTDRVLGGVCGGLATCVGVNSWWVRAFFVVLGLFTAGTGVLIYLALWFVLPAQTLADIPPTSEASRLVSRPEAVVLVGLAVIGMGVIILARSLGILTGTGGDAFLPLVLIGLGFVLLVKQLWRAA